MGNSFAVSLVVIVLYLLAYSSMHYDEIAGIADNQDGDAEFFNEYFRRNYEICDTD